MASRAPLVQVEGLTVAYGDVIALDAVDLTVSRGLTVVLGVNGSGKSSLLKAMAGAVQPIAGSITYDGADIAVRRRAGDLAYVPQADAVDTDFPLTVADVVAMGRYASRESAHADREHVAHAISRARLDGLERRQIGELSGGQRRRTFLARAIAQDASLVILDEPVAGLDPGAQATFYAVLRTLVEEGRTVVMSSHDLAAVPEIADEAILVQQRVVAHGAPADVVTPEVLARAFGVGA